VRALFDEMAETYGIVNLVSSFGFALRWRRQAIARLPATEPLRRVADLMAGMGELWPSLARRVAAGTEVVAVDISAEMIRRARGVRALAVTACVEDALAFRAEAGSFDVVVSSFGLKTFDRAQQASLARLVASLLRPGGTFTFIEISVPPARALRLLYTFYVKQVIPLVGRALLGNPANYRLLGIYTEAFRDCEHFARELAAAGLEAQPVRYFFGCATGVVGRRRARSSRRDPGAGAPGPARRRSSRRSRAALPRSASRRARATRPAGRSLRPG
jgi:demethylmenaquinone methyltransferase/2-methoxy-6-polyprenyl-1,4-benzoquinol methylase